MVSKAMFPYSTIAQDMSCGPTKLSYLISFWDYTIFHGSATERIEGCPHVLSSPLMSLSIKNLKRSRWNLLLGISRMVKLKVDTCHLDF